MHVGGLISAAIEVLLPSLCLHCGVALAGRDNALCRRCWAALAPACGPSCPLCGGPGDGAEAPCPSCHRSAPPQRGTAVWGEYAGVTRSAIVALKHGRRDELAVPLGRRLAAKSQEAGIVRACDAVTAVPTHNLYRLRRGYSAAELLARQVARDCSLPYARLLRRRGIGRQARRSRAERLRLGRGSFRAQGQLRGRRLLLVDDVTTTGATLRRAVDALHLAGARAVFCAVLARAPDPRRPS